MGFNDIILDFNEMQPLGWVAGHPPLQGVWLPPAATPKPFIFHFLFKKIKNNILR